MRICAARTGQLLNKSEIAKEVGVTAKTINDWLSVLEASNQLVLLEPFFRNVGKRVVKTPKLYFADSGLACSLLNLDERTLPHSSYLGAIWESFVLSELRKNLSASLPDASIWFYRDQQREVDFLISYGGRIYLSEAKWSELPSEQSFGALRNVKQYFDDAAKQLAVFSSSRKDFPLNQECQVISGTNVADYIASLAEQS